MIVSGRENFIIMEGLPVGFRFYPTEEEIVSFYLRSKLNGTRPEIDRVIPVINIYDHNPWELQQFAGECCPADTEQWFFFTPRQESEARGGRINRLTKTGYWKATGSPGDVYSSQNLKIGRKKTMVFYEGRAPGGKKTDWKMNEYKLYDNDHESPFLFDANLQVKGELSLCRIYMRTKSMRAFDRRPPSEAATDEQAAVHHRPTEAITIQQLPTEISTANDHSSSSVEHITNASQSIESENNWDLAAADYEPMWDWEEYFCFDI